MPETGDNVELRPVSGDDLDYLWGWLHGTPDAEWKQWDAPYFHSDPPLTREQFIAEQTPDLADPNRRIIAVNGGPVGLVTRHEEAPAGGGWWELGILIFDPEHWGRGLGGSALGAWVRITFAETDAHVLTVTTWSGNDRMIASARRIGFQECARVPEARSWAGRRWDSVKLAIHRQSAN